MTTKQFLKESEFYEGMPNNLKAVKAMAEDYSLDGIAARLDKIAYTLTAYDNTDNPQAANIEFLMAMRNHFNTLAQDNGMPVYIPTNN